MHSIRASMQSVSTRRTYTEQQQLQQQHQSVHHQHSLNQFQSQQQSQENSLSSFELLNSSHRDDKLSKWNENDPNLAATSHDCIDSSSFISSNMSSMSMASSKFSCNSERSSSFSKICEDDMDQHHQLPPALPIKQRPKSTRRKERHISHYDNVEGADNFPNAR